MVSRQTPNPFGPFAGDGARRFQGRSPGIFVETWPQPASQRGVALKSSFGRWPIAGLLRPFRACDVGGAAVQWASPIAVICRPFRAFRRRLPSFSPYQGAGGPAEASGDRPGNRNLINRSNLSRKLIATLESFRTPSENDFPTSREGLGNVRGLAPSLPPETFPSG